MLLFIISFIISLDLSPPIVFDLRNSPYYPPSTFPCYYTTAYKSNHFLKIEYEKAKDENIKFIEIYIKGKGNLPYGIEFNQFLVSINKKYIEGKPPEGFTPLSDKYVYLARFKIDKEKGEIVVPFTIILKVEQDDNIYDIEPINLNISFRINVK